MTVIAFWILATLGLSVALVALARARARYAGLDDDVLDRRSIEAHARMRAHLIPEQGEH